MENREITEGYQLNYKSKCRSCGKVEEWFVARSNQIEYRDFSRGMHEKMLYPFSTYCECSEDYHVIHDMIGFTKEKKN